jgi:asparagine synthase (glutamine-hydrolysing)
MPGLCGIAGSGGDLHGIDAMLASMRHFDWQSVESWSGPTWNAGRVVTGGTPAAESRGHASVGPVTVVAEGDIYWPNVDSVASAIAERWLVDGPAGLHGLEGSFAGFICDDRTGTLHVVTDTFGMRPVYWAQAGGHLLFGSEIKAILASGLVSPRLSEAGVSQFFAFGQLLADCTLFEQVRALPPAACLTWHPHDRTVSVSEHKRPRKVTEPKPDRQWVDQVDERLTTAVARATVGPDLGLSLSGGLDARTILGVAPAGTTLTCLSLGVPGGIDHRAAADLARLAGQRHHRQLLDGNFLERFSELLLPVVRLTDGHFLDQGIVFSTLGVYRDLGVRVLLRGHAGELMHMRKAYAFSLDDAALSLDSSGALDQWLWQHLSHYMIGEVDAEVFATGRARRLREAARDALSACARRFEDVTPVVQRVWHLFVRERLHRETAMSLQMFRSFVDVRVPFLDSELVELLLEAPPSLKTGDMLQTELLRRHRPEFLGVTNTNTGAALGAPPWRVSLASFTMRALAKLGLPGYQPYERLGLWLARDLQPLLRDVLLSEQFLDRQVFSRDAVVQLLEQHARRDRNHTYLLQAMLVFELGQRELCGNG